MKTVGERIRQAREYRRLSGAELAAMVGYKHQSAIGNIENRDGHGGRAVAKIAHALKLPVDWFLSGPDLDDLSVIDLNPSTRIPPARVDEGYHEYKVDKRAVAHSLINQLSDDLLPEVLSFLRYLISTKEPTFASHE